jgi:hypothetical protein
VNVVLLIVALVIEVLAAFGVPAGRVNLVALGLVFLIASFLVGARIWA